MDTKNILKKRIITLLVAVLIVCFYPQIFPISFIAGNKNFQGVILSPIPEAAANTDIEVLRPTGYTDNVSNTTNPSKACDEESNDSPPITSAEIKTGADGLPSIVYHTWKLNTDVKVYESLTLNVSRSSTDNLDDKWGIKYSINGGASWLNLEAMNSNNVPQGTVSVTLNPSQDLSKLQVRIDTDRVKTPDGGHVFIYDIRTEGKVLVQPKLYQSSYRFFEDIDSVDLTAIVSDVGGAREANSIVIDQFYMYVAGFEPGKWRIEKRSLQDGRLVASETSISGGGAANAIVIDDNYMYVVGDDYSGGNYKWRIEKRELGSLALASGFGENGDGVVISDPSDGNDSAYAIAIDPVGGYMYVVGSDRSNGPSDSQWRIEKRSLSDGSLVAEVVNNPSIEDDVPLAIAIDQSYMYVVGYDRIPGSSVRTKKGNRSESYPEWRIEKRFLSGPNELKLDKYATSNPINHSAVARGVAVGGGAIYVVGSEELGFFDTAWRIEKRDIVELKLIPDSWPQGWQGGVILENPPNDEESPSFDDQPYAIAIDGDFMYVAGHSATGFVPKGAADTEWRIEKRSLADGFLAPEFGNSGIVINDIYPNNNDRAYAIAIDPVDSNNPQKERNMYVAGYDNPGLFSEWRIEKRRLSDGSLSFLVPLSNSQNPIASIPTGEKFRLRMLIHVETGTLLQNGQQFKLQFSTNAIDWQDVTGGSDIAFADNPTPSNGDAILGNREDPNDGNTIRYQTYVEKYQDNEGNVGFSNSVSNVTAGEDGMWDFSLYGQKAGTYLFRIVKDNGSSNALLLDDYIYPLPEITIY